MTPRSQLTLLTGFIQYVVQGAPSFDMDMPFTCNWHSTNFMGKKLYIMMLAVIEAQQPCYFFLFWLKIHDTLVLLIPWSLSNPRRGMQLEYALACFRAFIILMNKYVQDIIT